MTSYEREHECECAAEAERIRLAGYEALAASWDAEDEEARAARRRRPAREVEVELEHYFVTSRYVGARDEKVYTQLGLGCVRCAQPVCSFTGHEPVLNADALLAVMHEHEREVHR